MLAVGGVQLDVWLLWTCSHQSPPWQPLRQPHKQPQCLMYLRIIR